MPSIFRYTLPISNVPQRKAGLPTDVFVDVKQLNTIIMLYSKSYDLSPNFVKNASGSEMIVIERSDMATKRREAS